MSGTGGAAPPTAVLGLGLDTSGAWHHRAVQKSRALVHTYLHPPPGGGGGGGGGRSGRAPLRLPSLVAAAKQPRRRSSLARLSLSEPSLLSPDDSIHPSGGSSSSRRPSVLQKRPPPPPPPPPPLSQSSLLLPCRTGQSQPQQVQSCSRPSYIHFSQAIQPSSRPRPARRHSHNPTLSADTGDLRPLATQRRTCSQGGEPLSVVGKPCVLSCGQRPSTTIPAAGPARTQLHVFLPTEAEGEEADSESVDEGFMDELDSKMTSLKLQQGGQGTLTYH